MRSIAGEGVKMKERELRKSCEEAGLSSQSTERVVSCVMEILKNARGGSGMSTERVHDRVWGGRKRECGEVNCLLWDEVESKNINDKGRMEYGAN